MPVLQKGGLRLPHGVLEGTNYLVHRKGSKHISKLKSPETIIASLTRKIILCLNKTQTSCLCFSPPFPFQHYQHTLRKRSNWGQASNILSCRQLPISISIICWVGSPRRQALRKRFASRGYTRDPGQRDRGSSLSAVVRGLCQLHRQLGVGMPCRAALD